MNWLSFIEDDPTAPGTRVRRYVAGRWDRELTLAMQVVRASFKWIKGTLQFWYSTQVRLRIGAIFLTGASKFMQSLRGSAISEKRFPEPDYRSSR